MKQSEMFACLLMTAIALATGFYIGEYWGRARMQIEAISEGVGTYVTRGGEKRFEFVRPTRVPWPIPDIDLPDNLPVPPPLPEPRRPDGDRPGSTSSTPQDDIV